MHTFVHVNKATQAKAVKTSETAETLLARVRAAIRSLLGSISAVAEQIGNSQRKNSSNAKFYWGM